MMFAEFAEHNQNKCEDIANRFDNKLRIQYINCDSKLSQAETAGIDK